MADPDYSTEEWRDIPGWQDLYQASSLGRIRSKDREVYSRRSDGCVRFRGRVLRQHPNGAGYLGVSLSRGGKKTARMVHRLICETFHGPCPPGRETAHGDGNKNNNEKRNLRWATSRENEADKTSRGDRSGPRPASQGTKHWNCRISDEQVSEIRGLRNGGMSQGKIAKIYGVSREHVRDICSGRKRASAHTD